MQKNKIIAVVGTAITTGILSAATTATFATAVGIAENVATPTAVKAVKA